MALAPPFRKCRAIAATEAAEGPFPHPFPTSFTAIELGFRAFVAIIATPDPVAGWRESRSTNFVLSLDQEGDTNTTI